VCGASGTCRCNAGSLGPDCSICSRAVKTPVNPLALAISAQTFVTIDGSSGGSLRLSSAAPDGADVPAGAFFGNESLGVLEVVGASAPPLASHRVVGAAKDFKPDGLRFSRPVRLRLSYADSFSARLFGSAYAVWFYNGSSGTWEKIPGGGVDLTSKFVFADTDHFSLYAIMEEIPVSPSVVSIAVGVGVGGAVLIVVVTLGVVHFKRKRQTERRDIEASTNSPNPQDAIV
jgi:hypothetical protein